MTLILGLLFNLTYSCEFSYTDSGSSLNVVCNNKTKTIKVNDQGIPISENALTKKEYKKLQIWQANKRSDLFVNKADHFNCRP